MAKPKKTPVMTDEEAGRRFVAAWHRYEALDDQDYFIDRLEEKGWSWPFTCDSLSAMVQEVEAFVAQIAEELQEEVSVDE